MVHGSIQERKDNNNTINELFILNGNLPPSFLQDVVHAMQVLSLILFNFPF